MCRLSSRCSSSAVQVLPCGLHSCCDRLLTGCLLLHSSDHVCVMLQALGESPVADLASGREELPTAELRLLADDAGRGLQTEGRTEADDPEYMRHPKRSRLA